MNKVYSGFLSVVGVVLVFLSGHIVFAEAPFLPEMDARFDKLEAKKVAHFVFDSAIGSNASSTVDSGVHGLGVHLPAKAVITRSYLYVKTQLVSSTGGGTLAYHCEDANNIKTATDMTGSAAGALIEGASTGAASAFTSGIAASCEIKATNTHTLTAGKQEGWVEYITTL